MTIDYAIVLQVIIFGCGLGIGVGLGIYIGAHAGMRYLLTCTNLQAAVRLARELYGRRLYAQDQLESDFDWVTGEKSPDDLSVR